MKQIDVLIQVFDDNTIQLFLDPSEPPVVEGFFDYDSLETLESILGALNCNVDILEVCGNGASAEEEEYSDEPFYEEEEQDLD